MTNSRRTRRFKALRLATAVVALPIFMGNTIYSCDPGAQPASSGSATAAAKNTVAVNQPYTGTSVNQPGGTFTQVDNQTVQVTDAPFTGTLASTLPKKIELPTGSDPDKTFKLKSLSGTFYLSVDGTTRANGDGNWTGTQLIRSDRKKLGLACVSYTSTSNNRSATGSFQVVGGTKAMKRIRFSGTFTQQTDPQGNVTGQIVGTVKLNKKKKGLTDECRALKPLVP